MSAYNVSIAPPNGAESFTADTLPAALMKFRKEMSRSGTSRDVRRHEVYAKPSERQKAKSEAARRKVRKNHRRQLAHEDSRDTNNAAKPWLLPKKRKRPALNLQVRTHVPEPSASHQAP